MKPPLHQADALPPPSWSTTDAYGKVERWYGEEQMRAALASQPQQVEPGTLPVAYLRPITHPDWLEVCDAETQGAFPVYAATQEAEPVAWQARTSGKSWGPPVTSLKIADGLAKDGYEIRELYTAPQQAAAEIDVEGLTQVLNQARCNEGRTVGNRELALRVVHFLKARQAPEAPAAAQAYRDATPDLHVGDSAFESWFESYSPSGKGDKQRARDAYAAGMGDPLLAAQPAPEDLRRDAERYRWLRNSPVANGTVLAMHFGGSRMQDFDAAIDAALAASKQGGAPK